MWDGLMAKPGYLKTFDRHEDAVEFLGGEPVLSPLAALAKVKHDDGGNVLWTKWRLILDCKKSQVTEITWPQHRIVLPRATDVIDDVIYLLSMEYTYSKLQRLPDWEIDLLIADIVDAFWNVPLHPTERRFYVARYRQKLLVWLRTAQGSRSAPLIWGQFAALLARLIQDLFDTWEARVQVYVDDPILAAAGDRRTRDRCNTTFVCSLLA